jgi:hypothetical protein
MRTITRRVENIMKDRNECMLVGGDLNGRIGERGARNWEEEKRMEKEKQKTKWKTHRGRG